MKPHKHADLIKQWADGAEVQVLRQEFDGDFWEDAARPRFNPDVQYRIKPSKKVVRWSWAYYIIDSTNSNVWALSPTYMTDEEAAQSFASDVKYRKLEWSREEFEE